MVKKLKQRNRIIKAKYKRFGKDKYIVRTRP